MELTKRRFHFPVTGERLGEGQEGISQAWEDRTFKFHMLLKTGNYKKERLPGNEFKTAVPNFFDTGTFF